MIGGLRNLKSYFISHIQCFALTKYFVLYIAIDSYNKSLVREITYFYFTEKAGCQTG